MHGALLCVLGLVNPPDVAYANAAHRHFLGSAGVRLRALALVDELKRDARAQRDEQHRQMRRNGSRFALPLRVGVGAKARPPQT